MILPAEERRRIFLVVFLQIALGVLDLLGVSLIGLIGSLAVSGIASKEPITVVSQFLDLVNLDETSLQNQVLILGLSALFILLGKSYLSFWISRRISFYLSRRGAQLSGILIQRIIMLPLNMLRKRSLNENLFALTTGVTILMLGTIANSILIIADLSMLLIVTTGLFVVDPWMALLSTIVFSLAGMSLYFIQSKRAQELGSTKTEVMTYGNQKTLELFQAYREIVVRNSREHYSKMIVKNREKLAELDAQISVMQHVSKYTMEGFFLLVIVSMSAMQFVLNDAIKAVGILSMFLAASARISPGILRIQQNSISIRNSLSSSRKTIELFEDLANNHDMSKLQDSAKFEIFEFDPTIKVDSLYFTYPMSDKQVLNKISFEVKSGEFVALVGPSGSGKSTLFDCCLGIQIPESGSVLVSGLPPQQAFKQFPGSVAFVPQEIFISAGTIRENLLLGFQDAASISEHDLKSTLETVDLLSFVENSPNGLDSLLIDHGANLSAGQKQRLGLARALLTNPKLIFLDEATSNLDAQTENKVSDAILKVRNRASILMIAHRLSTVVNADKVIYLDNGEIRAKGTFPEVRTQIPDFERQAQLMGL